MTWDVLFLIPLIWTSPVLAPLLVSLLLVAGGLPLARRERAGHRLRLSPWRWVAGIAGLSLMLVAFMANHGVAHAGGTPDRFPWLFFGCGWLLTACAGWRAPCVIL